MKKAFRYDGSHMDEQIAGWDGTEAPAIRFLRRYTNTSVTENGAVGYRTTEHPLVDLNFKVSSLRNRSEQEIIDEFQKAYAVSPKYAVKWLFFLRDILEGMGERRIFRTCMGYLAQTQPEIAAAVMKLIPEYGRFDDLLVFLDTPLEKKVVKYLKKKLNADLRAEQEGRAVSLLAKWLPSINTSSHRTRAYAYKLAKGFGMDERTYRKTLSRLRAYSNVLEVKLSASQWEQVDYAAVPAKANMKYDSAFARHDLERRTAYLEHVLEGNEKLNFKGIMPYEIVHRIMGAGMFASGLKDDLLAELMWEKLVRDGFQNDWGLEDCIVVADGSGSMYEKVGNTTVTAVEVANALAIYFAEQLKGVFHNKAITFSARPQFIAFDGAKSLKEKLQIMYEYGEIANTNIEAVFRMLLDMAVSNEVPKEELPKQILIISDMEFDEATQPDYYYGSVLTQRPFSPRLFNSIQKQYEAQGYQMPRLIFWNVCGRTDTIPMIKNGRGLCFLSGFSQNAMKVAAHQDKKDPYESLIQILDSPRYEKVERAWEQLQTA